MAVPDALLRALDEIVGAHAVLTKPEDVLPCGFDGTAVLRQRPGAVVFPRTTQDVARCVRAAGEHGTPIVTRGSGTGLSGGSVPDANSLVVCPAEMRAMLAVDAKNLTLRAQPG
jgi:glycolate oxidase